mgnify:CR=1 FL=1
MRRKLRGFICEGDHFARDCPFKGQLYSLVKALDAAMRRKLGGFIKVTILLKIFH